MTFSSTAPPGRAATIAEPSRQVPGHPSPEVLLIAHRLGDAGLGIEAQTAEINNAARRRVRAEGGASLS
jgi:hypothetical protein